MGVSSVLLAFAALCAPTVALRGALRRQRYWAEASGTALVDKAVHSSSARNASSNLVGEVKDLMTKVEASSVASSGCGAKKPLPKPKTSPYSLRTCRNLFAYKDDRDLCFKLQKKVCTTGCECALNSTDAKRLENCTSLKDKLCAVPKLVVNNSAAVVVENGSNTTLTFCNAYVSVSKISIQQDKYYALPDPSPFIKNLSYMECAQAKIPAGTKVNVYLGNFPMSKFAVGSKNAIVMLGQYNLGEAELGLQFFTFKDQGYKRPIICSAYPAPKLDVSVVGRNWRPFSDAYHASTIGYMECEKLNLDHADSVYHPESLEFFDGKMHKGDVEISPTKLLWLIGGGTKKEDELKFKGFDFGNFYNNKTSSKPWWVKGWSPKHGFPAGK